MRNDLEEEILTRQTSGLLRQPLVVRIGDSDFQRMQLAENRLTALERNDIKRSVYDRMLNAAIAMAVSAAVAMHDHLGIR